MSEGPSPYDQARIGEIVAGEGDWFSAHLIRLIAKADRENRARLRKVFPEYVEAYESWHRGEDGG